MNITNRTITFKMFNEKWRRLPNYAEDTKFFYKKWYLNRYGYKTEKGLKNFLKDKAVIMDAGCGMARDAKLFKKLNPNSFVVAVDQSPYAVKAAKEYLKDCINYEVVRGDITTIDFPTKLFDFISCDQVMHHTPNPNKTLKHFMSLLAKGGVVNFSVCKKRNKYRNFVDDVIMQHGRTMTPKALWDFSIEVTKFAKALYELDIKNKKFEGKTYKNIQRFVHDHLFRCWYHPDISFELSVCQTYDWFSGNPRFSKAEVKQEILKGLPKYKLLRMYEDNATISVSLKKL